MLTTTGFESSTMRGPSCAWTLTFMRSKGGGVGSLQTIPGGRVTDFEGAVVDAGAGPGVGPTTTTGVGTGVGIEVSDPHEISAKPVAAQTIEHASFPVILVLLHLQLTHEHLHPKGNVRVVEPPGVNRQSALLIRTPSQDSRRN